MTIRILRSPYVLTHKIFHATPTVTSGMTILNYDRQLRSFKYGSRKLRVNLYIPAHTIRRTNLHMPTTSVMTLDKLSRHLRTYFSTFPHFTNFTHYNLRPCRSTSVMTATRLRLLSALLTGIDSAIIAKLSISSHFVPTSRLPTLHIHTVDSTQTFPRYISIPSRHMRYYITLVIATKRCLHLTAPISTLILGFSIGEPPHILGIVHKLFRKSCNSTQSISLLCNPTSFSSVIKRKSTAMLRTTALTSLSQTHYSRFTFL